MIFRKRLNLPSGALLFAESLTKISKQTVKDELKSLKKIFNEIKKTRIINRTRNKRNKKWHKKKVKYVRWWNKRYTRKVRCRFNNFNNKM